MRMNYSRYNRRGITALDVVLVIAIIIIGLLSLFFINKETKVPRDVIITVDKDEYASIPLVEEKRVVEIEEKGMVVLIENNKVFIPILAAARAASQPACPAPITAISYFPASYLIIFNIYAIG